MPLLGGGRICHFRSNMGTDWGHTVLPLLPALGALPTDILVSYCPFPARLGPSLQCRTLHACICYVGWVSHSIAPLQVGNFAVWINNDTEYEFNLRAVTDYLQQEGVRARLPFLIWRDASVQHFSASPHLSPTLLLLPAWRGPCWRPRPAALK